MNETPGKTIKCYEKWGVPLILALFSGGRKFNLRMTLDFDSKTQRKQKKKSDEGQLPIRTVPAPVIHSSISLSRDKAAIEASLTPRPAKATIYLTETT